MVLDDVEELDGAPCLLAFERARRLPQIVAEGEDDGSCTRLEDDGRHGNSLLDRSGAGDTVALSSSRPSGLEVDTGLALAETIDDLELACDEKSGVGGNGTRVEEGVDVGADLVHDLAELGGAFLPDIEGLGGRERSGVSCGLQGGLGRVDEGGELAGGAVAIEDGLVTQDNQLDEIPLGPRGDLRYLILGSRDAGAADEDTDDQLDPVGGRGRPDVRQGGAVGAV